MNRIAIYGIGGLYNYGCEAIVRGTVEYIKNVYGNDVRITYYSRNVKYDKTITDNLGINIIDITQKSSFFRKCISKAIDILELPITPFFSKEFDTIINNSDVIVSVGGDIYTIPKYLRNKKKYRYVNYLVEFGEKAIKAGKKVVIYGASIGPFGNYDKALNYFINHLRKIDQIICREEDSVEYLNKQGITNNVFFLPDPAFLVGKCGQESERKYIGINLSELSLQELYGKLTEDHLLRICNLISDISLQTGFPLMLIPHVISPHTVEDNDLLFLEKVIRKLPENIKETTVLVKPANFIDVKTYLNQCKIVIAARMHCAVNSIIEGTPAIFLAYSQKAKGMAKFIYGDERWCVPIQNMDNDLLTVIDEFLGDYNNIKTQIDERNSEISELYKNYFTSFNLKNEVVD